MVVCVFWIFRHCIVTMHLQNSWFYCRVWQIMAFLFMKENLPGISFGIFWVNFENSAFFLHILILHGQTVLSGRNIITVFFNCPNYVLNDLKRFWLEFFFSTFMRIWSIKLSLWNLHVSVKVVILHHFFHHLIELSFHDIIAYLIQMTS